MTSNREGQRYCQSCDAKIMKTGLEALTFFGPYCAFAISNQTFLMDHNYRLLRAIMDVKC